MVFFCHTLYLICIHLYSRTDITCIMYQQLCIYHWHTPTFLYWSSYISQIRFSKRNFCNFIVNKNVQMFVYLLLPIIIKGWVQVGRQTRVTTWCVGSRFYWTKSPTRFYHKLHHACNPRYFICFLILSHCSLKQTAV